MFDTLVEAHELLDLIESDAKVCVFDCRFNLTDTDAGRKLWLEAHIPGAFYAHLDDDLSGKIIPSVTGRHPLPDKQSFVNWLRQHGVDHNTQIIAYDSAGGVIAARLWWLCRWIGHKSCAILNGGINAWYNVGKTSNSKPISPEKGCIAVQTTLAKSLNTTDIVGHKKALLIDAREYQRFLGEQEPIDPVAGHIPGAVSYPFSDNLDEFGKFKNVKALQARFSSLANRQEELVVYCGSGVTATHNIIAMALAGFDLPVLYEESWSGWILDPTRDIATGTATD